ncbi:MAG TPA: hypothetical protein VFG62_25980 [Rhodopila sp.]|jgi:hypothetical protein|nr:hypothetical protein [Rhodopila sp.]
MTVLRDTSLALVLVFAVAYMFSCWGLDAILSRTDVAQVAVAYQPMVPLGSHTEGMGK